MGTEPEMDSTPADKPPMKTVLYCRVSTADQTLEHQRVQAEAAGYRFDEVVVDLGISGVRTALRDRPEGKHARCAMGGQARAKLRRRNRYH